MFALSGWFLDIFRRILEYTSLCSQQKRYFYKSGRIAIHVSSAIIEKNFDYVYGIEY